MSIMVCSISTADLDELQMEVPHQGSLPDGAVSPPQVLMTSKSMVKESMPCHAVRLGARQTTYWADTFQVRRFGVAPGAEAKVGSGPKLRTGNPQESIPVGAPWRCLSRRKKSSCGWQPVMRTSKTWRREREQQKASGKTWRRGWLSNLQVDHGATTPVSLPWQYCVAAWREEAQGD
jgi:hypothetical protein